MDVSIEAIPNTVQGNRDVVRLLLWKNDRAFARALNAAVISLAPSVVPAREYDLGYDSEAEAQAWMNEIRGALS